MVRPWRPVVAGSVRAMVMHQSDLCTPVASTFSPSSTNPPATASARVAMFDRSLPAPASVYALQPFTVPAHAAGTTSARCCSDPNATTLGATITAAVSIRGASWYAASKPTTACQLGGRAAAAELGGQAHPEQARGARPT